VALTLLLATTTNASSPLISTDEQQQQHNKRNLAIVKDTLYSPAKAGKPNYNHHGQNGGHTGPRPNNGRGGKGGKASTAATNEKWGTEWGGFGYSKGSKAQSTPLQWESAGWGVETDEEYEVENEYTEEEGIDMGTTHSEDYPNADEEDYEGYEEGMEGYEESEEEVATVYQVHPEPTGQLPIHQGGKGGKLPIHHGQNGGHTGPRPTHNVGGSKGGKAAAHGGEWGGGEWWDSSHVIEDTIDANISADEEANDSSWVGMDDASHLNTDIHDSWAASSGWHAAGGKAGKATSQPIKGTSSWSSAAKAVKTTWSAPPVKKEEAAHSSNDASWHSPSSDTSSTVSESMKPKAEKQPLTEYFIKEPTGWGGAPVKKESKSGKSSKTKSSKTHVEWGGASDNRWNDHGPVWKGSGKAAKDHPSSPVTSSDEEEGFYLYTADEQVCTFIPGELTNITMEGAETFATKDECCDKYPQGCQDEEESVPVPSPADGLTPTEDLNTMLTMEPTSAVVGGGEGTIVDVASSNEDLSTLVTALKAANLVDALSGDGPITVFAPTNEAFENLPEGTLETLLNPENIEDLQSILTYHAVNGMIMSSDLVTTPIATLNGEDVQVTVNEDGSVMINNANVVTADIMGGNGVVHIIDAVLLPPSKPEDGIGEGESEGEGDAKYWPYQDDEGVKTCEYNADYPSVLVDGGLVFDTLAECCAIPGGEDITNCNEVERAPPANRIVDDDDDDGNTYPTYSPTGEPDDFKEPLLSAQGEEMVAMEPFGLRFLKVTSGYNDETALSVTQAHLTHSFRTQGWDLARMSMMVLEEDRRRRDRRVLTEVDHEIVLGGVLYFSKGVDVPTVEDMESIIKASFENERLEYYIDLLEEEGMYIESVELDTTLQPNGYAEGGAGSEGGSSSFNWSGLAIGLSCSIVGLIMLVFGSRYGYNKYRLRQLNIDNLVFGDLEKGRGYRDYAIQLKKTSDEMDEGTAAETALDSKDQLSVPSLVQAAEDRYGTPGGNNSYSSKSSGVSPLESPRGTSSTRYISVFTVKKDCGGKPLNQVDLRALAIAYLSRMLKKFPNTHLLPYDKTSTLPAIKNIRTLPDDLEELQQYVGNARVDDKTGKVLFNLRVESDEPVSKMKSSSGSTSSRSTKAKKHTATPLPKQQSGDPSSPRSPGVLEDVDL